MHPSTWIPTKTLSSMLFCGVFITTWLYPIWPAEHALHSSLTIVGCVFLWRYLRKNPMQDRDFFLIIQFLCLHSVAARWLYSNVPYERWWQSLFGFSLNGYLGWTRNQFDRLVHLLYGVCFTPAIAAHFGLRYRLNRSLTLKLAVAAIMLTSLCYEWFEWLIAITLSAKDAEAYNGQQGDMWDAHKDMLLATIGSLFWLAANRIQSTRH